MSITLSKRRDERGHAYLPDLGKAFSFSTIKYDVSCALFIYSLYYVERFPSISSLLITYIVKRCWILSDAFSAFIEIIMWFLASLPLMWFITLIDFCMLNHPFSPGINLTGLWYMILLICCWLWLANILLGFLCLCSSEMLAVVFFVWIWYHSNADLMRWVRKYFLLF